LKLWTENCSLKIIRKKKYMYDGEKKKESIMSAPSSSTATLKQKIFSALETIPPEGLKEVDSFLEYLHHRYRHQHSPSHNYVPVALGGLRKGIHISKKDIEEVRKEMWNNLNTREL